MRLCRKSIDREELFAYTNGHFLIDEQRQLELRYVKFDVDALCDVSAAAGPEPSPVTAIEKMEGGFAKAFLIKRKNGTEVIAKPCRNVGPPKLTTASEVAVLQYIKQNTDLPVPSVYSWSSDILNPVRAEYIVMEKAKGVQLFQRWGEMKQLSKMELIKSLTKLENQLASIRFPAYGSLLILRGPSCERAYMLQISDNSMDVDKGPWSSISAFGKAIANTQISKISHELQTQLGMFYHGTSAEQIALLRDAIQIMELLDRHPILSRHSQPILWHSDLHMGNIFVSPDEQSRIVSFIDWQSISILPAFLQEKWPIFLKPPSNYAEGYVLPKLPDDFENLDSDDKALAMLEWNQTRVAKAYELANFEENRPAYDAMNIPRVFKEFFVRCSEVSEYGVIPLRTCLIEIFQSWVSLGFTGSCPYSFSDAEIQENELRFQDYHAWHAVQELAKTCLDADADGWISPELDFEEKQRQNKELLGLFIERMEGEKRQMRRRRCGHSRMYYRNIRS
ncbi:hypothetical protein V500_11237 [Pseudogymnoascus sp. VKM F-4518 (FW-2643)]|nr:hypothetical protein V500_11237 [Pseudogymnoascus sp. VKM F-4518 (FW-2643)]